MVLAPGDAGREYRIGNGVLPVAVVVGVGVGGPGLADVRDIAVVKRLDESPADQRADQVGWRADKDIELVPATPQDRERVRHRGVGGERDLAPVCPREVVQAAAPDAMSPGEDLKGRILLWDQPARDRLVGGEDR